MASKRYHALCISGRNFSLPGMGFEKVSNQARRRIFLRLTAPVYTFRKFLVNYRPFSRNKCCLARSAFCCCPSVRAFLLLYLSVCLLVPLSAFAGLFSACWKRLHFHQRRKVSFKTRTAGSQAGFF